MALAIGRARVGASLLVLALGLGLAAPGCSVDEGDESTLDTRLRTHAVIEGAPSKAGFIYLERVVEAHRGADGIADPRERADHLRRALEHRPPPDDGLAELAELELRARAAESLLEAGEPAQAQALLLEGVAPERSLPIDRASARCLIALGDAAAKQGDHALAMGSYARALELLSLLMEEAES